MLETKRDWKSSDMFSLEDWNRIVSNALSLYRALGADFDWLDCSIEDTASMPYYDIINNLESNLYKLSLGTDTTFVPTVWQPRTSDLYTHNPSCTDFNRWEQFEYDLVHNYSKVFGLYSGNFSAGLSRVRQSLGRSNAL